jgi:phage host-nuclease inhibitor protein Gam
VADVTGILAASAAITGAFVALRQRKKILNAYETQMTGKCRDLVKAIEEQLALAIDVFYAEVASAFHPLQAFCTAKRLQFEPSLKRTEELRGTLDALNARIG